MTAVQRTTFFGITELK